MRHDSWDIQRSTGEQANATGSKAFTLTTGVNCTVNATNGMHSAEVKYGSSASKNGANIERRRAVHFHCLLHANGLGVIWRPLAAVGSVGLVGQLRLNHRHTLSAHLLRNACTSVGQSRGLSEPLSAPATLPGTSCPRTSSWDDISERRHTLCRICMEFGLHRRRNMDSELVWNLAYIGEQKHGLRTWSITISWDSSFLEQLYGIECRVS